MIAVKFLISTIYGSFLCTINNRQDEVYQVTALLFRTCSTFETQNRFIVKCIVLGSRLASKILKPFSILDFYNNCHSYIQQTQIKRASMTVTAIG